MTMTWRYKKLTPVICFPRDLLYSEAFKKLSGQTARVYWFFLAKKKMEKGPDGKWMIANDGEICFPYSEAPKYGIGKTSFKRAIDELVNHGFIKIAHQGNGHRQGDVTLYGVSEEWRKYGTPEFHVEPRKLDNTCRTQTRKK